MTYVKKQVLPALSNSDKVPKPDLATLGNQNYTSTILKYGNLTLPFYQLKTNAKTVVAAINELYSRPNHSGVGGGTIVIPNPYVSGDAVLGTDEDDYIVTNKGQFIEIFQGDLVGNLETVSIDGDIYNVGSGDGKHRTLTQEEYNALTEEEKNNGTIYFIEDIPAVVLKPEDLRSDNAEIGQILSYTRYGLWEPTVDVRTLNTGDVLAWGSSTWTAKHLGIGDIATITSPQNGQALIYDSQSHNWINGTVSTVGELDDLTDVDITTPSNGQVLKYDNGEWINANESTGVAELNDLSDVDISSATDGQVLKYDNGTWVNADDEGGETASDITYDNTDSGLIATNVQDAIDELAQGGGAINLDDLSDVDITSAQSGQVLKFDGTYWVNASESTGSTVSVTQIQSTGTKIATITVDSVGTDLYAPQGGGGATTLDDLTDVSITSATDGQVLTYDSTSGEWINDTISVTVDAEAVNYDNTTSGLTADDVQEAIDEVVDNLDDKAEYVELTQLEYDALSPAEKSNGTLYFITDANGDGSEFQPIICAETEREIGVFTDGKPLYQRTYNWTGSCNSGSYQVLDASFTNSEYFTALDIKATISQYANNTYSNSIGGKNVEVGTSTSLGLYFENFTIYTVDSVSVTIRYTKSSDTSGSGTWTPQGVPAHHYSEDEHVVGTWIDGNTLYEKTYEIDSIYILDGGYITIDATFSHNVKIGNGYVINSAGTVYCLPDGRGRIFKDTNGLRFQSINGGSWSGNLFVTIRYTKTSS